MYLLLQLYYAPFQSEGTVQTIIYFISVYFRNNSKKESLTIVHLVVLVVKISFDSVSRILMFSSWLYVTNDGQFDTWTVTIAYYAVVVLMFIFNLIFHKKNYNGNENIKDKRSYALIDSTGIVL